MHNFRGVRFTGSSIGTVVGDSGTILRTTNGGTTWTHQSSGTLYNLHSVSFIDANTGTVVGDSGTILRTTNGGTTWTSQSIGRNWDLYGVSFTVSDTGTTVGYYTMPPGFYPIGESSGGVILRTTNGGTTWTSQQPDGLHNAWTPFNPLSGVYFTDANTGTVVGGGALLRTTNGGGYLYNPNWTSNDGYWVTQTYAGIAPFAVCFTDANTGTVVGGNGTILHTTTGGVTAIENTSTQFPKQFALEQNYPNPFNPSTTISFYVGTYSYMSLRVYDLSGREVATLVDEKKPAGKYTVRWNAEKLSSGIYFYRIRAGEFSETKKMILLR